MKQMLHKVFDIDNSDNDDTISHLTGKSRVRSARNVVAFVPVITAVDDGAVCVFASLHSIPNQTKQTALIFASSFVSKYLRAE